MMLQLAQRVLKDPGDLQCRGFLIDLTNWKLVLKGIVWRIGKDAGFLTDVMWTCAAPGFILQIPSEDFGLKTSRSLNRGQVLWTDYFLVPTDIFWPVLDAENPDSYLESTAFRAFGIMCSWMFQDFFSGLATARIECSPFPLRERKVPAHSGAEEKFPGASVQAELGQPFWKELLVDEGGFFLTNIKNPSVKDHVSHSTMSKHRYNISKAPFALLAC